MPNNLIGIADPYSGSNSSTSNISQGDDSPFSASSPPSASRSQQPSHEQLFIEVLFGLISL